MPDIKVQHILTLAHLLSKGARYNFVTATTAELGRSIKRSQQAASKHLRELEETGFIERIADGRNRRIRITSAGYDELVRLDRILGASIDTCPSRIVLEGRMVSGMGEGAYYMSLKGYTRQFRARIGHVPFPGTINVRLDKKEHAEAARQLDAMDGVKIDGFSDGKRTYGRVKCFAAKVNSVDSHVIRPERTHHDSATIEIISRYNIRRAAGLSDGSKVTIEIPV